MRPQTAPVWLVCALTGCATYHPAPIEPTRVLEQLQALEWSHSTPGQDASADGEPESVGPRELSSFAISHNPRLAAARAQIGVQRALLVEAELLPDPELSWDGMDVLASEIVNGTSGELEVLSGFGLMFQIPRPGERGAQIGAAEWHVQEVRQIVASAEWTLTRDVHVAYEQALAAEILAAQAGELATLAGSTSEYFQRARDAGAVTAIQANLALGELQGMQLAGIRADARMQQARQELNALLGLPPETELPLRAAENPSEDPALDRSSQELMAHALDARPDLAVLLARHEAAEQDLRLAISTQYPLLAIGTGLRISLPFFSDFGRPAMQTAKRRRAQVALEYTAAVHSARQEIAAARTLWQLAGREVELVENELLPNAEQTLALSRQAFQAGEVTLLETLALQRALVQARTRHAEARAERSKQAWVLLAASGGLLGPEPSQGAMPLEDSE